MQSNIENALRLCPQLPTLPGVALELVSIARNPDVDLGEVTRGIACDPALAAKVLRIANSSLYHQFRPAHTLGQAVRALGLNTTVTLSLSFSLAAGLRACHAPGIDLAYFWRRALIAAWAARLLAEQCEMYELDEPFLASLLQDIGRPALDAAFPGIYAATQDIEADHDRLISLERDQLATDHLEAGAWLVREWQMPEYLPLAILGSHDRSRRHGLDDRSLLMGCVAVSGRIADIYLAADSAAATTTARHVAAVCLGMNSDALSITLDRLVASLAEVEALFETPVLSAAQARGLTDQARELMITRNLKQLYAVVGDKSQEDEFRQIADQLYNVAHRDALTDAFNRRHFDEALAAAFTEAGGHRQPLSLAYLDLDDFKATNDQHGHLAGDAVLTAVTDAIHTHLRPSDLLARYGGDEFVVLLPGLGRAAAYRIVERIRAAVEALAPTLDDGTRLAVTLSIGLATYHEGTPNFTTPRELVHAADQSLYAAKHQGRNRVIQAE